MKYMLLAFFVLSPMAFASQIEGDMISVDGNFKKREEQIDRLKKMRAKLEKQNEMLMRKKIESIRYQQEMELMKKMQQMFADNAKQLDSIE